MTSTHNNSPGPDDDHGNRPPSDPDQDRGQSETDAARKVQVVIRSGRGIRRLVTLCGSVNQLVWENDRRLPRPWAGDDDDDDDDDDEEEVPPERREELKRRHDRNYQAYLELVKFVPSVKDEIANRSKESRMLYYSRLIDGANSAASDDRSAVKHAVANFLNARTNNPAQPPLCPKSRDGRGLQNDFTGRLLCPTKYDWEDLTVRAKIRDGIDGLNAFDSYWLRCLYEGEQGDPEDVEEGFLKSTLLVKTFQTIFTSPSSADGDLDAANTVLAPAEVISRPRRARKKASSKRPNVAALLEMDGRVTVRAIAYAAVQLHFALSDATHWMSHYNGFNYEEFYEFIIDFFEADQTPSGKAAARELQDWWNRRVFPRSASTRATLSTSVRQSSLAMLQEQRQARLARQPS